MKTILVAVVVSYVNVLIDVIAVTMVTLIISVATVPVVTTPTGVLAFMCAGIA